jgi:ribosome-binding protein aMBF1 (putative translation factor)
MNPNPLHRARRKAGLSAFGLATAAGTREPRIFAFERQRYRPTADEGRRIAEALNDEPARLFPDGFQRED